MSSFPTLSSKSLITVTPVAVDGDGNALNKGVPTEATLGSIADFIVAPVAKPADLVAAPTAADFNGLVAKLVTAGVLV